MKLHIELDDSLDDIEVIIRAPRLAAELERIQQALTQANQPPLIFYKGTSEYFLPLDEMLFFETDGSKIFGHTKDNYYEVKLKLYELESALPASFCRVAKSTIVNIKRIYSLDRSFSGTSTIRFNATPKQVHVSRHYYQLLKEKLQEMRS